MDYGKAFIKLYGAAGAAIEELYKIGTVTHEITEVIAILKSAVAEVEAMTDSDSGTGTSRTLPGSHVSQMNISASSPATVIEIRNNRAL